MFGDFRDKIPGGMGNMPGKVPGFGNGCGPSQNSQHRTGFIPGVGSITNNSRPSRPPRFVPPPRPRHSLVGDIVGAVVTAAAVGTINNAVNSTINNAFNNANNRNTNSYSNHNNVQHHRDVKPANYPTSCPGCGAPTIGQRQCEYCGSNLY